MKDICSIALPCKIGSRPVAKSAASTEHNLKSAKCRTMTLISRNRTQTESGLRTCYCRSACDRGLPQFTSGYTLEFDIKTLRGLIAYLKPFSYGSIGRFMNHSSETKCWFVELRYRRVVKILIVAQSIIEAGDETTIDYGAKAAVRL
ncbi:SET domain [Phytophthora cactorum]|nr:SET domain [Phytophthora cactorum]